MTEREAKTIYQYLDSEWFNAINERKKIIEGRLKKAEKTYWVNDLKIGDIIVFEKLSQDKNLSKETLKVQVTNLVIYKSFIEMFDENGLENVLPGIKNNKDGVQVYRRWYSEDKEKELGVIAIFIKLLD